MLRQSILYLLLFFILFSCNEKKKGEDQSTDLLSQRAAFEIAPFPADLQPADSLFFSAIQTDSSLQCDSLILLLDQKKIVRLDPGNIRYGMASTGLSLGRHQFRLLAFREGKEQASASAEFILHSGTEPESWTYELVKILPHNPTSFTQGLEWHQGKLYEGTGLNGKSAVMEIRPATGDAMKKTALPQEHFGEGITILNQRLYQLTWQSHRAFIYSLPEISLLTSLSYPTEGWGLTHMHNELIMSDGSEKLYFLNPDDFSLIRSIEVWDRKNAITELNELEASGGFIYANKYQTDTIVKIDPKDGRVMAYINMAGLLKPQDRQGNEDVLNGIAWNPADKLWYLTGKNWPKMFAVRLMKKNGA